MAELAAIVRGLDRSGVRMSHAALLSRTWLAKGDFTNAIHYDVDIRINEMRAAAGSTGTRPTDCYGVSTASGRLILLMHL